MVSFTPIFSRCSRATSSSNDFGQAIDLDLVLVVVAVLPQFQLCQTLVGERGAHHETGVPGRTAKIDQPAFGQRDHAATGVLERVTIDGTDVGRLDLFARRFAIGDLLFQPGNVDFGIEVTDVAEDRIVGHLHDVFAQDDVLVAGRGDEQAAFLASLFHRRDFETFHRGLQCVDRIDLGHHHTATVALQRVGTTFADVAVTANHGDFAGQHHVGGTFDTVRQRFAATVQVVELALGRAVVDVDGGHLQLAGLVQDFQAMNAGGGFFADAVNVRSAVLGTDRGPSRSGHRRRPKSCSAVCPTGNAMFARCTNRTLLRSCLSRRKRGFRPRRWPPRRDPGC